MQNSKRKMQNYISKFKNIKSEKILHFELLFVFLIIAPILFNAPIAFAKTRFPVRALGNCRDAKECRLYCDIPSHTPACWSYQKYILGYQVLGETTSSITYPIADLDNCLDAQSCFQYCQVPDHQSICLQYAQKLGISSGVQTQPQPSNTVIEKAAAELGCKSKEECQAFCNKQENYTKCREFARNNGLQKHNIRKFGQDLSMEVATAAGTELGCSSEIKCMEYCNKPENKTNCMNFSRKHGLAPPSSPISDPQIKNQLLSDAKELLGCDSFETCASLCDQPKYLDKCKMLGKKFKLEPSPALKSPETTSRHESSQGPGGCGNAQECRTYCEKNPSECPGFISATSPQASKDSTASASASYLGPSGCKTEAECKAYCENHPQLCPGYPQISPTASLSNSAPAAVSNSANSISNPASLNQTSSSGLPSSSSAFPVR